MTYVRCTTISLKVDYIAVTSSLRLEDALTRAKLIFAQGIQYIMAAVAEDGVCCSNTINAPLSTKECYVLHP